MLGVFLNKAGPAPPKMNRPARRQLQHAPSFINERISRSQESMVILENTSHPQQAHQIKDDVRRRSCASFRRSSRLHWQPTKVQSEPPPQRSPARGVAAAGKAASRCRNREALHAAPGLPRSCAAPRNGTHPGHSGHAGAEIQRS